MELDEQKVEKERVKQKTNSADSCFCAVERK